MSTRHSALAAVALCAFASDAQAGQLTIAGSTVTGPGNCIPFGMGNGYGPYMGMVYQNIPPFTMAVGDSIYFNTGALNDTAIVFDIALATATVNGGDQPVGGVFTTILTNQTASPSTGDTNATTYELRFTATTSFTHTGGGLLIRFRPNGAYAADASCTGNAMYSNATDPSNLFVKRCYYDDGAGAFCDTGSDTSTISVFRLDIASTLWYRDADGDGYGDKNAVGGNQTLPGYVGNKLDCNDGNPAYNPAAVEDTYGVDKDCDSNVGCYWDQDRDGYGRNAIREETDKNGNCSNAPDQTSTLTTDCNDTEPAPGKIYPTAPENTYNVDSDCDTFIACYRDADGDSFGGTSLIEEVDGDKLCDEPSQGTANDNTDCADGSNTTFPGAAPNNSAVACMQDLDGDDWGAMFGYPAGATAGTDCNDTNNAYRPNATETAYGVDYDCDLNVACYRDLDQDGYGTITLREETDKNGSCANKTDSTSNVSTDCNDGEAIPGKIYPTAPETVANGIDDNCDLTELCYTDNDQDGFGVSGTVTESGDIGLTCDTANKEADDANDCQDSGTDAKFTFPGSSPNNGALCMQDVDGDDWGATTPTGSGATNGTDCNDTAATGFPIKPGVAEIPGDGLDQNCDNAEACYVDNDQDAYGTTSTVAESADVGLTCDTANKEAKNNTDCQDTGTDAKFTFPGSSPNNNATACMQDVDGDDWGALSPTGGGVTNGTDCNDTAATGFPIKPGASEIPGDGVDQNCDSAETCFVDNDQDGYGTSTTVPESADGGIVCDTANKEAKNSTDCQDSGTDAKFTFPGAAPNNSGAACMQDVDGDDWGAVSPTGSGATNGTDCNDTAATGFPIKPGVAEVAGDGVDQNCDGAETCYVDNDQDTYGTTATVAESSDGGITCDTANKEGKNSNDCQDTGADAKFTFPGAAPNNSAASCMQDVDGDDWGATTPTGSGASNGTDCNDTAATGFPIKPGVSEIAGDGIDQNCDSSELCYLDNDQDSFGTTGTVTESSDGGLTCDTANKEAKNSTDCQDTGTDAKFTFPGAAPNTSAACLQDVDGDDYGATSPTGSGASAGNDCNDTQSAISPAATELPGDEIDQNCDSAEVCYADADDDGFRGTATTTSTNATCDDAKEAATTDPLDCSSGAVDNDAAINPGATEVCDDVDNNCNSSTDEGLPTTTYYADKDDDTFGASANGTVADCALTPPVGYEDDNSDCNDNNDKINTSSAEVPYDGLDNDCASGDLVDVDGDGFDAEDVSGPDCNDNDDTVHPGVTEVADGVDQDCNDLVDDKTDAFDDDGDGFSEDGGDCDDTNLEASPAGAEICDDVDQDCDGVADNGTECFDDDGDGYDENFGDCDDDDDTRFPGNVEDTTNGIDDDCDNKVDEGGTNDPDGDGFTTAAGDCEPNNPDVYPGAPELENSKDDNCDGRIDDGTDVFDDDEDGYTEDDGDCDDGDADISPDAVEDANGVDDNCDGEVDEGTSAFDDDGDGVTEDGGDCDDDDKDVSPAETEVANGIDDNCDGAIDEGFGDQDGDGFSVADGDCDDTNADVVPGMLESCDGVDNNCDSEIDEGCEGDDTGTEEKKCGCATGGGTLASLVPLAFIGLFVRRRRR